MKNRELLIGFQTLALASSVALSQVRGRAPLDDCGSDPCCVCCASTPDCRLPNAGCNMAYRCASDCGGKTYVCTQRC